MFVTCGYVNKTNSLTLDDQVIYRNKLTEGKAAFC